MDRKPSGFLGWINRSRTVVGVAVAAALAGMGVGMTIETVSYRRDMIELVEAEHKAHHVHEAPNEVTPTVVASTDSSVHELDCQKLIRREVGDGVVITMLDDTWYIEQNLRIIDYAATAPSDGREPIEYMCRIDLRSGSIDLRRSVG